MVRYLWLLLPALLSASPARYARVADFDGIVEVQLSASDQWIPAERNLPLPEGAWIRTGSTSRVEIELDEGSVWRLGPESQGGLSDYTQHSTGQRVTLLLLDRGLAYFTGQASGQDSLMLVAPGAQVSVTKPAKLRFEAAENATQLAVLQGMARLSSPAAEIDVVHGQTSRVEPAHSNRFFLYRDVAPIDLDRWSAERDKTEASAVSGLHVAQRYGLCDLDSSGAWVDTEDLGTVWKPRVIEGWRPYRDGHWRWMDGLGYSWIADESWGWLPYHYGRWRHHAALGWVWTPSQTGVFKPGDVFWMRGAKFAAWGPLAPGEDWTPGNMPAQYLPANLTYAAFVPENPVIDPAGFKDVPKEPLKAASFVAALPSPSFDPTRLEASRPLVRLNNLRGRPEAVEPAADPQPARTMTPPPAPAPAPPPPADDTAGLAFYQGIFIVNAPSTANASNRFAHSPRSRTPTQPLQTASTTPEPKPIAIPIPNPSRGQRRPPPPKDMEERSLKVRVESNLFTQDFEKSLAGLDEWSKRYPQSKLSLVRLYDYMQAHSALGHPERVLEYGAAVMANNPTSGADGPLDEQQTAGVLYLTMANAATIARPTPQQRALGAAAAQSLLDSLEHYFQADRRPENASSEQWANSRRQLETAAHAALKKLAPKPAA